VQAALRFGLVVIAGFLGGSLCGSVVLGLGLIGVAHVSQVDISDALQIGVVVGGGFGIVAFPICYYVFLRDVPLWLSLAVTIPSTIIVASLGTPFLEQTGILGQEWFFFVILGPGFLGLLLSTIALNRIATRVN
jgi:hypothetical protein